MDLKDIFIVNLKKFRKIEGISQMELAKLCDTDVSYIGQIEIGRRFPSMRMIEKMAVALKLAPYRLFMNEPGVTWGEADKTADFLACMPQDIRKDIIARLNAAVCAGVMAILAPQTDSGSIR
ncbi:MAG: helix-turn-helix transcriptional regulator [Treponema sp.]|jgi:transcriptional regulator with XRE-family HTH domain|nr:helix-turn-helix transcriptional regulator [Treponema sp.]